MLPGSHGGVEHADHIRCVKHRRHVQVGGLGVHQECQLCLKCIGHLVGVRQHHALGKTCGAAGVIQPREIIGSTLGGPHRTVIRDQRFMAVDSAGIPCLAHEDEFPNPVDLSAAGVHGGLELLVDEQDGATGVLDAIRHLGRRKPNVDRHHHCARPGAGEQAFEVAMGVQADNADPVAVTAADRAQARGETGDAFACLPPAVSGLIVDDGGCAAIAGRAALN